VTEEHLQQIALLIDKKLDLAMEKYATSKYQEWSGLMSDINKKLDMVRQLEERTLTREELTVIKNFVVSVEGAGLIGNVVKWLASVMVAIGALMAAIAYFVKNF
jgi:hypothetical protein